MVLKCNICTTAVVCYGQRRLCSSARASACHNEAVCYFVTMPSIYNRLIARRSSLSKGVLALAVGAVLLSGGGFFIGGLLGFALLMGSLAACLPLICTTDALGRCEEELGEAKLQKASGAHAVRFHPANDPIPPGADGKSWVEIERERAPVAGRRRG